jgi:hypothetical protein
VAPLADGDQLATGEALTATRARNEGPGRRLERVASWRYPSGVHSGGILSCGLGSGVCPHLRGLLTTFNTKITHLGDAPSTGRLLLW